MSDMDFRTKQLIWPVGKEASAAAYKAWADAANQTAAVALGLRAEDFAAFTSIDIDRNGRSVTRFFGPNYTIDGVNYVMEPEDGPAMRAAAAVSDTWEQPEE